MFFHFHEPLGFLNAANDGDDPFGTRRKQYESLSEQVSGILYGLTYWGDYGGDSVSRYHFDTLVENCEHIVTSVEGAYGQGLVLTHVFYGWQDGRAFDDEAVKGFRGEIQFLKEFMSWAIDAPSDLGMTRKDYPIFDDNGFSDWEFEKIQSILRDDVEGWMGSDIRTNYSTIVGWDPDIEDPDTNEILDAISYLLENGNEYPYFESAVDIVLPGIRSEDIAQRIHAVRGGEAQQHQEEVLF